MARIDTDFVVYGATWHGLLLARYAADAGMRVVVLEWTGHIGGTVTGGLGVSDWISLSRWGRVKEFFQYIGSKPPYNLAAGEEQKDFTSTEAVAALNATVLNTNLITIVRYARLNRVQYFQNSTQIEFVELQNGDRYYAPYYGDSSYEVDLAWYANIKMRYGWDSLNLFNERVQEPDKDGGVAMPGFNPGQNGIQDYRARDGRGDRYPTITQGPARNLYRGSGRPGAQSYGFRYSMRYDVDRLPWPKPPGWSMADQDRIVHLVNSSNGLQGSLFPFGLAVRPASGTPDTVPASPGKYICNGGDLPGIHTNGWGNKSYEDRIDTVYKAARVTIGANWTVANDLRIPESRRTAMQKWGLPLDEFQEDGSWIFCRGQPAQFYIRDDRSILGQFVITTDHILSTPLDDGANGRFSDGIAIGGYPTDLKKLMIWGREDGRSEFSGALGYNRVQKYSIPLRACLPHPGQCTNLVVGWGASGSTVFRSSYRIEQTVGLVCQALGMYVGLAFNANKARLSSIPFSALKAKLTAANAITQYP